MKILIMSKFLHLSGGSLTYIFMLGEYLKTQKHEVEYFGIGHKVELLVIV